MLCCSDKHCYRRVPPAPPTPSGGSINGSLAALWTVARLLLLYHHTVHAGDNSTWLFWVLAVAVRVSPAYNIMAVDSARCCYLLLQSEAAAAVVAAMVVVVSEWAPLVLRAGAP